MIGRLLCAGLVLCGVASARADGWTVQPGRGDDGALAAIWGNSHRNVWFVSQTGTLLHPPDGGRPWSRLRLDAAATSAIWGAGNELYVLGPGIIYHSPEGLSWTASKLVGTPGLHAVWGSSAADVYVAGD